MVIKLVREFKQNQQLSITPQLKKSIDLLQLSRLEIVNKINNEIDENPFLKKDYENESAALFDDMDLLNNLPNESTLQNHLDTAAVGFKHSIWDGHHIGHPLFRNDCKCLATGGSFWFRTEKAGSRFSVHLDDDHLFGGCGHRSGTMEGDGKWCAP